MKKPLSLFAQFWGLEKIKKPPATESSGRAILPKHAPPVQTSAAIPAPTFAHLLNCRAPEVAARLREQQRAAYYRQPAATPVAARAMTTSEVAAAIIAAGEKTRCGSSPRYAHERIAQMMARAKHDTTAGKAPAIIKAAAKARGESV